MPIVHGDNVTGYKTRPIQPRIDGDGKEWIYARAHGALTAHTPYLAYMSYDGWRTAALFDTGYASASAASHPQYAAFVPCETVGSDTDAWGQCGGPCEDMIVASDSVTTGNRFLWNDAVVSGTGGATSTAIGCAIYGICMATASSGVYDTMLLGAQHLMFGTT